MTKPDWQIVPGAGAEYLTTLGNNARFLYQFAGGLAAFEQQSNLLEESANTIAQSIIDAAIMAGESADVAALGRRISEEQSHEIGRARLANSLLERLKTGKVNFLPKTKQQARLKIEKSGVGVRKSFWEIFQDSDGSDSYKQLDIDEVIEGSIFGLYRFPQNGGVLSLKDSPRFVHINGLVNACNGQPRVNLEILEDVSNK